MTQDDINGMLDKEFQNKGWWKIPALMLIMLLLGASIGFMLNVGFVHKECFKECIDNLEALGCAEFNWTSGKVIPKCVYFDNEGFNSIYENKYNNTYNSTYAIAGLE